MKSATKCQYSLVMYLTSLVMASHLLFIYSIKQTFQSIKIRNQKTYKFNGTTIHSQKKQKITVGTGQTIEATSFQSITSQNLKHIQTSID